jgi:hypothetical protein
VFGCLNTFNQQVIYVHFNVSANLISKHPVHQSLISGSCILQTEGHHLIAVKSSVCDESRFFLVCFLHVDLIVSREGIHKA